MSFAFENIDIEYNKIELDSPFLRKIGASLNMLANVEGDKLRYYANQCIPNICNLTHNAWSCAYKISTLSKQKIDIRYLARQRCPILSEYESVFMHETLHNILKTCFYLDINTSNNLPLDTEITEMGEEFRNSYVHTMEIDLKDPYTKCIKKAYQKYKNELLFSKVFIDKQYNYMLILIPAYDQQKQTMGLYIHPFIIYLGIADIAKIS